jgi:FMN-dependent oxidoreductase (nitrilotriacetate monooxygenase family)
MGGFELTKLDPDRRMLLAGFFQAGNVTHHHGCWRHPKASNGFLTGQYWIDVARALEAGGFDLIFMPDILAIHEQYGGTYETAVRYGGQTAISLDPVVVLATMAAGTSRIGVGATVSTTYWEPYHVARTFATLDHMSGGRAAWNVVTSLNEAEARNFGLTRHLDHDARYDRADDFMETVFELWESWEPDALVLDKEAGRFADATKVHYIDHQGEWFNVHGPLLSPRPPQEHPVIIQAGQSPRGRAFAARWADLVFNISPRREVRKKLYSDMKNAVITAGRHPDSVKVLTAILPIIGDTEAEALEKERELDELAIPVAGLNTLSGIIGIDLSKYPLEMTMSEVGRLNEVGGSQGLFAIASTIGGDREVTIEEVGRKYAEGLLVPHLPGTPEQIADGMERIIDEPGGDGFAVSAAYIPGAYEEFCERVVPILRERQRIPDAYQGETLRDHLGLPVAVQLA